MLKVGFSKHFHGRWFASLRLFALIAGFFPAVSVFAQPTISSDPVEEGTYGDPYIYNITTNGWINDVQITLDTPVPGITLLDHGNGTATLSGAPTDPGNFAVTITVADVTFSFLQSSQNFNLDIAKAQLTATANNQSRFYGYDDPPFTISYSGFKFTDNANSLNDPPIADPDADDNSSPGDYDIDLTGGLADDHYTFSLQKGTLTINPAPLTIIADDKVREYGDENPVFTLTYIGLQNGQTSLPLVTGTVGLVNELTDVGEYTISINGSSANYAITKVNGTLTIDPAPLTITADNKSRAYGDDNPLLTLTYVGLKNGQTFLPSVEADAGAVDKFTDVGNYPITVAGGSANYTITRNSGTLTINPAPLTITADNKSRTYGDDNPLLTLTYVGLKNGQTFLPSVEADPGDVDKFTAVGNYPITVTGGSANYTITRNSGTLTINPAPLTITADNKSRTYGDDNPLLTLTYVGLKNGQTFLPSVEADAGAVDKFTVVGTYPIAVTGGSANYTITRNSGTLTINPAALTITAVNKSKNYGDANPVFTVAYSGLKNSETLIPGVTVGVAPDVNELSGVGNYTITVTGGTSTNYTITRTNGTLTINAAPLTITAVNKSKNYGDANPAFTVTYSGLKNSETLIPGVTVDVAPDVNELSGVGNYTITVTGGTSANYTITRTNGTLTINPVGVTITAANKSKDYGEVNPLFTVTYTGLKNGETSIPGVTAVAVTAGSVPVDHTTPPGTYAINVTGGTSTNYTITRVPGQLIIDKATLTVTADNKTRPYGAANPLPTISYSGFVNGHSEATLATLPNSKPVATINANSFTNVGDADINVSGGSHPYYTFVYVKGKLSITKLTLTVQAVAKSYVYGLVNIALTANYLGFVNGDDPNDLDDRPTLSTDADEFSHVGLYDIELEGGSDNNYNLALVNAKLTVTKATLTITAQNQTRPYGAANLPLTVSYVGFQHSDDPDVFTSELKVKTTADEQSPVGTYGIIPSNAVAADYNIMFVQGTLTVTKAVLTVRPVNTSRPYGSPNPSPFVLGYTGFVNGDDAGDISPPTAAAPDATAMANVGNYAIKASGGTATNYSFVYVDGVLTITKAVLTVTIDSHSRPYGSPNPSNLTMSYSGFKNSQGVSVIDQLPTASTSAKVTSPVDVYDITASGGLDNNYSFNYQPGELRVTKVTLTATADDQPTTYGTIPDFSSTYTGFVLGEDASVIDSPPTGNTTANVNSDPGTYPISLTGGSDDNYDFNRVDGTLTITKAPLKAIADDIGRINELPNPELTITYEGFMNGETEDVLDTKPTAETTATISSPPGEYPITVSGGNDDHYDLEYQDGTFLIVLDSPPVPNPFEVQTNEDTSFPFDVVMFQTNTTDDPGGKISYITIETLPASGVLYKEQGAPVVAGDKIHVSEDKLGTLFYLPNSNSYATDSFTWSVNDGAFHSETSSTVTIVVKAINDAPVLANIESEKITYNPGDEPVIVTESLTISDNDDDFIFGATVSITTSTFAAGDELALVAPTGSAVEITYDNTKGELQLVGKDTRAVYEDLLTSITFNTPLDGAATVGDKLVNFVVKDSLVNSNIATRTISIAQVFPELDIVNAFTPNGDGVNDVWDLLNLKFYSDIDVRVFDSRGNQVYGCADKTCEWDGNYKEKTLPAGPYLYSINLDNGKRIYNGVVTILK